MSDSRTLQDVLAEYDGITQGLVEHPHGHETDFVMRRDDYQVLRDSADKYLALRTVGICDGALHFRITDEMDAAIGQALAAAKVKDQ